MTPANQPQEKAYQKYAWVILFLLSILLVVNILIVAGVADHASEFQEDTGVTWQELMGAYPGVAKAYMLNQQLLYVGFTSLCHVCDGDGHRTAATHSKIFSKTTLKNVTWSQAHAGSPAAPLRQSYGIL